MPVLFQQKDLVIGPVAPVGAQAAIVLPDAPATVATSASDRRTFPAANAVVGCVADCITNGPAVRHEMSLVTVVDVLKSNRLTWSV